MSDCITIDDVMAQAPNGDGMDIREVVMYDDEFDVGLTVAEFILSSQEELAKWPEHITEIEDIIIGKLTDAYVHTPLLDKVNRIIQIILEP